MVSFCLILKWVWWRNEKSEYNMRTKEQEDRNLRECVSLFTFIMYRTVMSTLVLVLSSSSFSHTNLEV